jgi:protease-4
MPRTGRKPFLIRIWNGIWGSLDMLRRIVVNIVFVLLLVVLFKMFFSTEKQVTIDSDTALVIRPAGHIVEQFSGDPLDRALGQAMDREEPESRLRDILQAIKSAKSDDRITQLVLNPEYIWSVGLASLQEFGAAITDFKTSGKPVIAIVENMSQHQYYFASFADEIWMHPGGFLWLDGYAQYRGFYKEALDKLAVEVNLFRVGEYKSAMEPFIRNDMSPEAIEANRYWLNSLWQQYLEGVAQNRGLPAEMLAAAIEDYAGQVKEAEGDFSKLALNLSLVDKLISRPEARAALTQSGAPGNNGSDFRQIGYREYASLRPHSGITASAGKVSVIVAEGNIVMGSEPPGVISADRTAQMIRSAARDDNVKAVVLRVNSPGGNAFASELIRRELQNIRDIGKPVVISMGDVAASGGYWISMAANEVWSNPATITGSIGIFGMIPTFPKTLARMGIHTDGVGTTPLAGAVRLDRSLGEEAREIFQISVENGYREFLQHVSLARNMSVEEVDSIARGRVWSGSQALERGLVDHSGGLQQAIDSAARHAGLGEDYAVEYIEESLSAFEQFVLNMTAPVLIKLSSGSTATSRFLGNSLVQRVLNDLSIISRADEGFTTYAHCLCSIQ